MVIVPIFPKPIAANKIMIVFHGILVSLQQQELAWMACVVTLNWIRIMMAFHVLAIAMIVIILSELDTNNLEIEMEIIMVLTMNSYSLAVLNKDITCLMENVTTKINEYFPVLILTINANLSKDLTPL